MYAVQDGRWCDVQFCDNLAEGINDGYECNIQGERACTEQW